jgi:N-ethylmaleimide reductase
MLTQYVFELHGLAGRIVDLDSHEMMRFAKETHMPTLFDPVQLGAVLAPNRIVMSPMTRGRGTRENLPTSIMAEYYAQRASAGLIIAEAAGISRQGLGWPFAPGIWSDEQVKAWRPVTEAVHDAGGRVFVQLWHMGRAAHPSCLNGHLPVSASATTAPDSATTYDGEQPYVQARALELEEIKGVVADYRRAAANAIKAGFDGVQLHAANGYLIDQFLRDGTNHRTDAYGGSVANRLRLLMEVVEVMVEEAGGDRTAVRLSANDMTQGCDDSNPELLFLTAAEKLNRFSLAFLEVRASRPLATTYSPKGILRLPTLNLAPRIREIFTGPLVLNQDYKLEDANAALAAGEADAISYGRAFIANPDLPNRLLKHAPLAADNMATWHGRGREGYTDYTFLDDGASA